MALTVDIKNNKIKAPLKGKNEWLVLKPEEQVRQEFICRLVNTISRSIQKKVEPTWKIFNVSKILQISDLIM